MKQNPDMWFVVLLLQSPPWMAWLLSFFLAQPCLRAADKIDPSLVPNIFIPESVPAHSISHLAGFVLAITGAIFVVVAGLLVYAVVRFAAAPTMTEWNPRRFTAAGRLKSRGQRCPCSSWSSLLCPPRRESSRKCRTPTNQSPRWMCKSLGINGGGRSAIPSWAS